MRIGTRGSRLALWQSERVRDLLRLIDHSLEITIVTIRSSGEKFPDDSFADIGIGVFTREIDQAVLDGRVDIGVHSLKDLPTDLPPGLVLAAVPQRGPTADAWVAASGVALGDLPAGARIGTSSPRRQAQLLHWRKDLDVVPLRGNVETRLRHVREQGLGGTILAEAGLRRLGAEEHITEVLPAKLMLPAVGQGALGVVAREDQQEIRELVGALEHLPSRLCVNAERAFLRELRGGCLVPAAALATCEMTNEGMADTSGSTLRLEGAIGATDGSTLLRAHASGTVDEALVIGERLAQELLARGGDSILAAVRGGTSES